MAGIILALIVGFVAQAETAPPETRAVVKSDIEYGRAGGVRLLLDSSVPDGAGPHPMVIIVHGGGWGGGDKQQDTVPITEPLTRANFTWFSINYRLAPEHRWPACFEDMRTAIRWVKAHAAEYRGDPERIALLGYSAGGQLVCLAAVRAEEDTRVQAVVGLAPPTDLLADTERRGGLSRALHDLLDRPERVDAEARAILQDLSPITHVKPGLPPFLLIHGTADKSVPYSQSVNFRKQFEEVGGRCDLVTMAGAPHAIRDWGKADPSYQEKMVAWLRRTLGPPATGPCSWAAGRAGACPTGTRSG
jgi:acetyl esterase/lipase